MRDSTGKPTSPAAGAAMEYALSDHKRRASSQAFGASVVNMSFEVGTLKGMPSGFATAVQKAAAVKIILVAAAGNKMRNTCKAGPTPGLEFGGYNGKVLTIGAVDESSTRWVASRGPSGSNFGDCLNAWDECTK